jgi:hypothetical protein
MEVREERARKQCAPDIAESMRSLSLSRMTGADSAADTDILLPLFPERAAREDACERPADRSVTRQSPGLAPL